MTEIPSARMFLATLQSALSAWPHVRQVFVQPDRKTAGEAWRHVADQLRPRFRRVAAILDDAEHDVLAYMDYPEPHRSKLHSTNPIERLNKEVKRRTNVVGLGGPPPQAPQ